MIWGAEAGSLTEACSALEAIAVSQGADAVIGVRFVVAPDTTYSHSSVRVYQGYGTAIRYS
jgi:uncharacterized protein YbjQ (UPF0145 family)